MVSWFHGVIVSWFHIVMDHGFMVSWFHGVMVSWCDGTRARTGESSQLALEWDGIVPPSATLTRYQP